MSGAGESRVSAEGAREPETAGAVAARSALCLASREVIDSGNGKVGRSVTFGGFRSMA